jgi:hypothetical protein
MRLLLLEIATLILLTDIAKYVKIKRLSCAGHIIRMGNSRAVKKVFNTRPDGTRKIGRPKLGREDGVIQDFSFVSILYQNAPRKQVTNDVK